MAGAVANLMVRAGADFSQLQRSMQQVQENALGFQEKLESAFGKVEKALAMVGIAVGMGEIVNQVKEGIQSAIELEATTDNLNKVLGQNAQQFIDWSKTTAESYGYSQVEAEKYGASFAHMISNFSSGTQDIQDKTENLMKYSAIIANGTGRSIDDVMQRIQSGMLGNVQAINDLGVYVNNSMIVSTEAFKRFANGKHWADLSFNTQQQILYYAILEQASKQYGDTLNQNVHLKLVQFTATLKNVQTALGTAFLPILNAVLPLLTAMANKVLQVLTIVGEFTQAIFGKAIMGTAAQGTNTQTQAINNQTGAVNGLASAHNNLAKATGGSSGSKSKNSGSTAGFDEVHTLASNASAGSAGSGAGVGGIGGGAGGLGGLNDLGKSAGAIGDNVGAISQKVQDFVNKIKNLFGEVSSFLQQHAALIIAVLAGIGAGIATFLIGSNWAAIVEGVVGAFEALSTAIGAISLPLVAVAALVALFVGNLVYLWETNKQFRDSVINTWNQISSFITQVVKDMWNIIKSVWDKYGADIWNGIVGFMKSIQQIILNTWNSYLHPLILSALNTLKTLWNDHLKGLVAQVLDFVAKLIDSALQIWNKFISPIVNYLIKTLGPIFATVFGDIFKVIGSIVGVAADVASGLFKALGGVVDFITGIFTGNWAKAWQGVQDIFSGIFSGLWAIVKTPLNWIIDGVNTLIDGLNKIDIKVPDWIPGIGGKDFGISIPHIPHLYKGGITNGATLAMIGDNAGGHEVVSPLDKLTGIVTNAVLTAMSYTTQSSSNNMSGDIILNIDGKQFARIIKPYTDLEQKRVGTNVRLQSL